MTLASLALALLLAAQCPALPPPPPPAATPMDVGGARIGLALGSGSMHGFAHIGVIQELEARGLPVRVVSGTSAGAIVGSLWASGLTGAEIERIARESDFDDLNEPALQRAYRGR